mgnify:CR=1 FL=1
MTDIIVWLCVAAAVAFLGIASLAQKRRWVSYAAAPIVAIILTWTGFTVQDRMGYAKLGAVGVGNFYVLQKYQSPGSLTVVIYERDSGRYRLLEWRGEQAEQMKKKMEQAERASMDGRGKLRGILRGTVRRDPLGRERLEFQVDTPESIMSKD